MYFKEHGFEYTTHALNRVLGQKKGKGKRDFTREEILEMLMKSPNYRQSDGKLVRFENGIAIIQAPDTGEIVSIVTRETIKDDWEEL